MWTALGWMALGGVIVFVIFVMVYVSYAKKIRW
jgi:uncharacterized membrane protein